MPKQIGIIGGGPKAASIAAKAEALRQSGWTSPEITIFEMDQIGGGWRGEGGYTDGQALLCTPADRDLGFPYDPATFGHDVAEIMMARFSWHQFLVTGDKSYSSWVNRGIPRPLHSKFATYLGWAVEKSGAEIVRGKVTGVAFDEHADKWKVTLEDGQTHDTWFDGIVVTGHGPPKQPLNGADARVFNGHDFWTRIPEVRRRLQDDLDPSVTIIGAGGTGAAVAAWFVRESYYNIPIRIIGNEPTLFTRSLSFFENHLFGEDESWERLSADHKNAFIRRLTTGVVWEYVTDLLAGAENVVYMPGKATGFKRLLGASGDIAEQDSELALVLSDDKIEQPASVFVDCCGFDVWWFRDLFAPGPAKAVLDQWRGTGRAFVGESLDLSGTFPHAGFHVPALASEIGPAANNLMALGWVSDHLLRPYLDQEELLRRL